MALQTRRSFLRASGVCLGLPLLETFQPRVHGCVRQAEVPRRLVAINVALGLHAPNIIPAASGSDFDLPPYLELLGAYRDRFTFISGCSHPAVGGGHHSYKSFLTAARNPSSAGFRNSISIDQLAAERLGTATRFRSLSLSSSGPSLSWSRAGVEVPAETRPSRVFEQLFVEGNRAEQQQQVQRLRHGRSVLDMVLDSAKQMQRRVSGRDREKIDEYFQSVREAEVRLAKSQAWQTRPKPDVDVEPPTDLSDRTRIIQRLGVMLDLIHLAIETDSTRFITFNETGMNAVPSIPGVDTDYHMLSHHGKDEEKIAQLTIVETAIVKELGRFLKKLESSREGESSLLERSMVLFGSNLGNASSHDTKNMPMLLAGGGFRHGRHLAFDKENNYPLPKLYVSMLQSLGLEIEEFAETQGTMQGIELNS